VTKHTVYRNVICSISRDFRNFSSSPRGGWTSTFFHAIAKVMRRFGHVEAKTESSPTLRSESSIDDLRSAGKRRGLIVHQATDENAVRFLGTWARWHCRRIRRGSDSGDDDDCNNCGCDGESVKEKRRGDREWGWWEWMWRADEGENEKGGRETQREKAESRWAQRTRPRNSELDKKYVREVTRSHRSLRRSLTDPSRS